MTLDTRELNEFTRKATELMSETSDVPRILRNQFGEQHRLTQAAEEMLGSIEHFVRELRHFDIAGENTGEDRLEAS